MYLYMYGCVHASEVAKFLLRGLEPFLRSQDPFINHSITLSSFHKLYNDQLPCCSKVLLYSATKLVLRW